MKIKTFDELTAYDERVMHIPQLGVTTGTLTTAASPLVPIQAMVADCDLIAAVPEHVRDRFEHCRALHTYGCFAYEFFTVAEHYAYGTLEAALGARFLVDYPTGIPLEDEHGVVDHLRPAFYSEVAEALRRPGGTHPYRRPKDKTGWILQGYPHFNGSMRSLLEWAWARGLLSGQRNRVSESALHQLRNLSAHPHGPSLVSQGQSAGAIRHVAEIINQLWGHATPGGRRYSGPLTMMLVCLYRGQTSEVVFPSLEHLCDAGADDRLAEGLWALLEVAHADEAFSWVHGFETTAYPTEVVWTGKSWADAVNAWKDYAAAGRRPHQQTWRGRLFLVRCGTGVPTLPRDWPRSPSQFRALAPPDRNVVGTAWWIVRADHPADALEAWRDPETIPALFRRLKREEIVPARVELQAGTWEMAEARLIELGQ